MRTWLPVPGTTVGKLVEAGLTTFGERGYNGVGVGEIATLAGVTTGSIYHHFRSKADFWNLLSTDIEQRVLDRIEAAAAVSEIKAIADVAPAMLAAFDYIVRSGYRALLTERIVVANDERPQVDRVEQLLDGLIDDGGAPVGFLIASCWRAALERSLDQRSTRLARASLERMLLASSAVV